MKMRLLTKLSRLNLRRPAQSLMMMVTSNDYGYYGKSCRNDLLNQILGTKVFQTKLVVEIDQMICIL